jgi:hypothetical protein
VANDAGLDPTLGQRHHESLVLRSAQAPTHSRGHPRDGARRRLIR